MALVLTLLESGRRGVRYVCEPYEVFVLGRETVAQVARGFPVDPYMSRRHVLFEVAGNACCVQDLGSRNGVYVNDVRISRATLKEGDVVRAGHTALRFGVEDLQDRAAARGKQVPEPLRQSSSTTTWTGSPPSRTPPAERAVPRTLAGYELLGEVARGGLGVVHRARERDSGRIVALKVMLGAREFDEYARAHFVREMSIHSDLLHPNVVRTYDVGAIAGETWIAMEYVDGTNLEQHIRDNGAVDIEAGMSIGIQLLRGLAHAHERGFIHRDVKPANVLVSVKGNSIDVKLADFGLAKSLQQAGQAGMTVTSTGDAKGSPWFVAPEQLEDAKSVDYRADIYSAGATIYYALTGLWHLRPDGQFEDFLLSMMRGHYVPITHRARVPRALARVVDSALARSPTDRPPSARELERVLVATVQALRDRQPRPDGGSQGTTR